MKQRKINPIRITALMCLVLAVALCASACVGMDEYWSLVSESSGAALPVTPKPTTAAQLPSAAAKLSPIPDEKPSAAPTEEPPPLPVETPSATPTEQPTPVPSPEPSSLPIVVPLPIPTAEIAPEPSPTPLPMESGKWNLTEYFADEAAFEQEAIRLEKEAMPAFEKQLDDLTGKDGLPALLAACDETSAALNRLSYYAQSRLDLDNGDAEAITLKSRATGLSMDFSKQCSRMNNKLLAMGKAFWTDALSDPSLLPYRRQLTKLQEQAAHTLPDAEETLLLPAEQALSNLMDTFSSLLHADLPYATVTAPDGTEVEMNYTNYSSSLTNPDRAYREAGTKAYQDALSDYRNTFAANLNAFVTLTEQLSKQHAYTSSFEEALEEEEITADIYNALIEAGRQNTAILQRNSDMRRRFLGLDALYPYDMRLPLGDGEAETYSYQEAPAILKNALSVLGEDYTADLDKAFTQGWIDAFPGENKTTGGYSGMAVDIHPWVLLNYTDDYGSLSTVAHELGHAVHQLRSYQSQESLYNKTPTALVSEVASLTNELLLSRHMIAQATDDQQRLYYLQQEFNLFQNAFFCQIQFADFERQMHQVVENGGALTADGLDEIYAFVWKTYNPGVEPLEGAESAWATVPHFYYNYYVQDYAITLAVAETVADGVLSGDADMLKKYQAFLCAGDSQSAKDLFATLGIDLTDPSFVQPLVARCNDLLDEIERLLLPA